MTQYEPFIDDREDLIALNRGRYLVVRAADDVAEAWKNARSTIQSRLAGLPVSYPARGHVTLGGLYRDSVDDAQQLARDVAGATPPLEVCIDGVGFFPSPFQIVFLRVRKTAALTEALTQFRVIAKERGLHPFENVAPDDWIFHLSVAYCRRLSSEKWREIVAQLADINATSACMVGAALELAAIDDGIERSAGAYTLV